MLLYLPIKACLVFSNILTWAMHAMPSKISPSQNTSKQETPCSCDFGPPPTKVVHSRPPKPGFANRRARWAATGSSTWSGTPPQASSQSREVFWQQGAVTSQMSMAIAPDFSWLHIVDFFFGWNWEPDFRITLKWKMTHDIERLSNLPRMKTNSLRPMESISSPPPN